MAAEYRVVRELHVGAPPAVVYERLVDLRRWRGWSPYEDLDPDMRRTCSGAGSGVGAVYEWSGDLKAGAGRLEVVEAVPDERVVVEQQNLKPLRSRSTTVLELEETDAGTRVTWAVTGRLTPLTRVMGLVAPMEKLLGPMHEKGLARLRDEVEGARPAGGPSSS
ncbi:SRPBCC family protein [Pseudokineococcus basanitobsidens]|uniref:SRPBCC family protein n=1 Tax=Pseudokineococcus basanitobsidens TaxID=1926649 RepID=A0ABU8RFW2_9ACTN